MTTPTTRERTLIELRAAVQADDQAVEFERRRTVEKIQARLAAATDGPWYTHRDCDQKITVYRGSGKSPSYNRIAGIMRQGPNPAADAALISHAPADVAFLLAQVERLTAERDLLLERADQDTQLAYWTLRSEHRGAEVAAQVEARRAARR